MNRSLAIAPWPALESGLGDMTGSPPPPAHAEQTHVLRPATRRPWFVPQDCLSQLCDSRVCVHVGVVDGISMLSFGDYPPDSDLVRGARVWTRERAIGTPRVWAKLR